MIKKRDVMEMILKNKTNNEPLPSATAFAPANIALCKYWGKRNHELNLPMTSSISISLNKKGSRTTISLSDTNHDVFELNDHLIDPKTSFYQRLHEYLHFFRRSSQQYFYIDTYSNIPTSAGLASSASGFAALVLALDKFFNWQLKKRELSILARLGSGSACRSMWSGFVEWHAGNKDDGMDSYANPFRQAWKELCVGLLLLSEKEKIISSREAMQRAMTTSPFYSAWTSKVTHDLNNLKHAIIEKDFTRFGEIAESNAMAMHATLLTAWPPIYYGLPSTVSAMHKIWELRRQGLALYFTQDAGPNLKLLFLQNDITKIRDHFPDVEIVCPFGV